MKSGERKTGAPTVAFGDTSPLGEFASRTYGAGLSEFADVRRVMKAE